MTVYGGAPRGYCAAEVGGPWITYYCLKRCNGNYCKEHEVKE